MTIILGNLINKLSTLFRKSQWYKKVHDHIDRFDHLGDETVNMVKMVNTKNDVRKVRNVRILKIITILSANFYTIGKIGRRYFLFVCPKLPKMNQKIFLIYANFRV